jgi:hypothetical protein
MDLGSGIRDPGSGKNLFRIPDPGVKKLPDPGSGSATLIFTLFSLLFFFSSYLYFSVLGLRYQVGTVPKLLASQTYNQLSQAQIRAF